MSKLQGADAIMSAAQLKPLLLLSKHGPVSCAIGMTKDKHGVILLDKKAKPRKVMAELRKAAAGASVEIETGSLRFGTASVNTEADGGLVHLTMNKEAPAALRPKLVEHLKKAGFGRCEIVVDEALEREGEEEDGAGHGHAAGHHAAPGPDAAALTHRLTTLVKAMAGLGLHGPELEGMKGAAVAAQGALKAGHAGAAEKDIAHLEHLLRAHAAHAGNGHAAAKAGHPSSSSKPLLHSHSGQELAFFKQLDAAEHSGGTVVLDGKKVPLAQAVQVMHDHLQHAKHTTRDLLNRYDSERKEVPAIEVFGKSCEGALSGVNAALNAKPPQLAAAYNHLQTAYLGLDDLQSQLSEERGLAVDNLTACMEGAKAVRSAACKATVVLAGKIWGKPGETIASVLTTVLENGSDALAGEKVNLGKAGAEIVLELLLSKLEKPLGHAIEHRIGGWIAAHVGPHFKAATGSELFHGFEEFMKKNAGHIPVGSPEYWAKLPALLKSPKLEVRIIQHMKTEIIGDGKKLFAEAAGAIAQPGDYTAGELVKRMHSFVEDVRSGKHLREDVIPKFFAGAAARALKH